MEFVENLKRARLVPVIVIKELGHAVPLAKALVEGGLNILEVTLRTPAALDAIRAISAEVKGAFVGAGTVINGQQFADAAGAGAKFVVSPGLTEEVVQASRTHQVPILPGVATASDIMRGLGLGLKTFKFFPAEASGGLKALKALAAPFYQCRFCPTGGITEASAPEWLAFAPVLCVGGSWVIGGTMAEVEAKARAAAGLR